MTDNPRRTRLVEPVECGLDAQDQETLEYMREHFETYGEIYEDPLDFLDRLPRMIEDRDRELADAEYEVLCAKLEVDTIRQLLAEAIAQSNGSRDLQRATDGLENLAKTITRAWDERDRLQREIEHLRGLLDGESHG